MSCGYVCCVVIKQMAIQSCDIPNERWHNRLAGHNRGCWFVHEIPFYNTPQISHIHIMHNYATHWHHSVDAASHQISQIYGLCRCVLISNPTFRNNKSFWNKYISVLCQLILWYIIYHNRIAVEKYNFIYPVQGDAICYKVKLTDQQWNRDLYYVALTVTAKYIFFSLTNIAMHPGQIQEPMRVMINCDIWWTVCPFFLHINHATSFHQSGIGLAS